MLTAKAPHSHPKCRPAGSLTHQSDKRAMATGQPSEDATVHPVVFKHGWRIVKCGKEGDRLVSGVTRVSHKHRGKVVVDFTDAF